jgi:hypothetical protein
MRLHYEWRERLLRQLHTAVQALLQAHSKSRAVRGRRTAMNETFYERMARIERERWQLLHTLREIVQIEEYKARETEASTGKVTNPPAWIREAKELIEKLED